MDKDRLKQFQFRMFSDMSAALASVLMHLGDRLGLFKTMADGSWMTSDELAGASGLQPRYVREWLSAMAARAVVEWDTSADRFRLPPEHAAVLADEDSAVFTGAWFQTLPAFYRIAPELARAFREGGGVAFADYGTDWLAGFARARRVVFRHFLVQKWLPLMDGMVARLQEGISVADFGCGHGEALIAMAHAFPRSRFVGFDADDTSLRLARDRAREVGVEARVGFRREPVDALDATAQFDLAIVFDCIHDLADPPCGLERIRAALRPGGRVLIQELSVGETLADNLNPFGAYFYEMSTLHCLTSSLARNGAGLGTAMPPSTLRRLVLDAGFASIERLLFSHQLYALYEARV